ncbi:ABC transporter, periplasmic substrate-binding protein [Syntrophotalea carbinolica DSM 2380]|uniref:ABC transporter, periplasmic substrate-binding protein n=1 Tax=Syntrophotalea carbinolica (strain DSM 2380 / NBRC 103641 / GraBd1) TaxID=338963 RepID=Q3A0X1_SYNC1|nr:MlaD family protein [Syntrophotalea carbinolica]ABA89986.1 ABC transporter, periplasmic substrate-binding protein [Syntrophotalea carbinolica DSM 2380]
MSERANYVKIGLFVIGAIIIAVAAIIVLGAGSLFQKQILVETYFDESVQGLDIGSAVKVRGVKVGKVEAITLVDSVYPTEKRYVLVRIALLSRSLGRTAEVIQRGLQEQTDQGLRLRMAFQGVTGLAFLEADYLPAEQAPCLEIDWQPIYPYIPSAPSTITRYTEAVDKILKNLDSLDIAALSGGIEQAITTLNRAMEEARVAQISDQSLALLNELRVTNQRLETLLVDGRAPLQQFFATLPDLSRSLTRSARQLETLTARLPDDLAPLGQSLRQVSALLTSEQQTIETTLENFRQTSENLLDMSENARSYPSQMLFGAPPTPVEP